MALAIDTEMPSNAGQGTLNADSQTYAFNNAAGTLLVVGVGWGCSGAHTFTISGVTYDGAAMTQFVTIGYDGAGHDAAGVAFYYKLNPSTGSKNVVVTMNANAFTPRSIESGAISFTGNDTTTPIVAGSGKTNFRESNGTTATVTSATTTSGNIALAMMATGSGYGSTSQTLSWSANFNTGSAGGCAAMTRTGGTGSTISWSDTVTSDFMGICCLEVAAASGGATRGLFRAPSLSGTGIGGSFFRDPLQAPMQLVRRDRIFVPERLAA